MRSLLKRTALYLLLGTLICACLPLSVTAAGQAGFSLSVTAFAQNEHTAVNLWWDETAQTMRLFLPSGSDPSALTVRFSGAAEVFADGVRLSGGESTDVFSVGAHTLVCDGVAYPLQVMRSDHLPAVFLDTASGSLSAIQADKNHKENGAVTIVADGVVSVDNAPLKSVKGRGNSTWMADKKPYNIKFDKKTDVLGMGKAKKWTLLANCYDDSLLRNSLALRLAADFGLPFTPEYRMVDLYANGEYQGNYLIAESVESGDARVAIADLEAANEAVNPGVDAETAERKSGTCGDAASRKWVQIASPENVTGGYLLEAEFESRYGAEASGFVTPHGQHVVLKSPEFASKEEVDYIAALYEEMEQALYAENGFNEKGRYYLDYFDADQLVKMYILLEYTFHRDAGLSSCFFYKDADETVLRAGPAWDFDLSLGNARFNAGLPFDVRDPESWWANSLFYYNGTTRTQSVFTLLYRHEDFRTLVSRQWNELSGILSADLALLPGMIEETVPSALMNAFRWGALPGKTAEEKEASYRAGGERLRTFAAARAAALDKGFGDDAAMVYYHANGGSGDFFNGVMLTVGETITLPGIHQGVSPILPPEKMVFAGWSTEPGGGELFRPGEQVPVGQKTVRFYAQWQRDPNQVAPVPAPGGAFYTVGDVDLNGVISSADARLALRTAVKLETLPEEVLRLADADDDKAVSPADARAILRVSVKLEPPSTRTVLISASLIRYK